MKGRGATVDLPADVRATIEKIVDAAKRVCRAERIVLFGSYATGDARSESDIDVLVVAETDSPFQIMRSIHRALREAGVSSPVDVVVVTPAQWEYLKDIPGQVVHEAAHYGVLLYEAA